MFECSKNLTFADPVVHIKSALNDDNKEQIDALRPSSAELSGPVIRDRQQERHDRPVQDRLRPVRGHLQRRQEGQRPHRQHGHPGHRPQPQVAVSINKMNYSHHVIEQTGIMNLNILSEEAPFSVFENFGFQSGRNGGQVRGDGGTPVRQRPGLPVSATSTPSCP